MVVSSLQHSQRENMEWKVLMIQFSQQVLQEILDSLNSVLEALAFMAGYSLARLRTLGGLFEQLVNSWLEGFQFGIDGATRAPATT